MVDKSFLDFEATSTLRISIEKGFMASRNINSFEKVNTTPLKKAKKLIKTEWEVYSEVKKAKAIILIIGICLSIML